MSYRVSFYVGVCIGVSMMIVSTSSAMVYDNRFFPLLQPPRLVEDGYSSLFLAEAMATTTSSAFDDDEETIGIPELAGKFDLGILAKAFVLSGKGNPLRSDLQGRKFPFIMEGKIQSQGVSFFYHKQIMNLLSVGCSWFFMRVNSRQRFHQTDKKAILGISDEQELDETRRDMFMQLGLSGGHTAQLGFSDIDGYIRLGNQWEYILKCRMIDAGIRLGLLFPTGLQRDVDQPASVPFGGNGHWGAYLGGDCLFELREDIKIGLLLRVSKRFARIVTRRLPVAGEPYLFGATVGCVRVNPGVTFVFSPFFVLENMRRGLGLSLHYTLTSHQEDEWSDRRADRSVPVQLGKIIDISSWGSDYFTLNVFYDFGKIKVKRSFDPILFLRWDVPSMLFVSNRIARTHKVAVGVKFVF